MKTTNQKDNKMKKEQEFWSNMEQADKKAFASIDHYESCFKDISKAFDDMLEDTFYMKQDLQLETNEFGHPKTSDAVGDLMYSIQENMAGIYAHIEDASHRLSFIQNEIKEFHSPENEEIRNTTFWNAYQKDKSKQIERKGKEKNEIK
jgi:hypothetical protein